MYVTVQSLHEAQLINVARRGIYDRYVDGGSNNDTFCGDSLIYCGYVLNLYIGVRILEKPNDL